MKNFSQLFNVYGFSDVRQIEIHTAEPLVLEPSGFEVETAIEGGTGHKSPVIDQIPAEMIKTVGRKIRYEIHKIIRSISNKDELPEEWNGSVNVNIYKLGEKADSSNYMGI